MIVVVAGWAPVRDDAREEVIDAAITMRKMTLEEPGCISYRVALSLGEPNDLILIEQWRDTESLAAHLSATHFTEFAALLRSSLSGTAHFTKYDVASASPLFE